MHIIRVTQLEAAFQEPTWRTRNNGLSSQSLQLVNVVLNTTVFFELGPPVIQEDQRNKPVRKNTILVRHWY